MFDQSIGGSYCFETVIFNYYLILLKLRKSFLILNSIESNDEITEFVFYMFINESFL